jgi:hypothetical protein
MQAIVHIALSSLGARVSLDAEMLRRFKRSYAAVMKRIIGFELERERLTDFLSERGIEYLVLKGAVLQRLYPRLGMRQMADNDILIDPAGAESVRGFMTDGGYSVESYGKGCHDSYLRDPLNFEIHRKLVSDSRDNAVFAAYFDRTRERLLDGESPCEKKFSPEDFYVYYIFHAYKHYSHGGIGLRMLMDLFVYRRSLGAELDLDYVGRELSSIGLSDFERSAAALADKVFGVGTDALSDGEREALLYYITSGTFGTVGRQVENSLARISRGDTPSRADKLRYILGRIFPPVEVYRQTYPRASRFIVTIPFLWLFRLLRGIVSVRSTAAELRGLKNAYKDN